MESTIFLLAAITNILPKFKNNLQYIFIFFVYTSSFSMGDSPCDPILIQESQDLSSIVYNLNTKTSSNISPVMCGLNKEESKKDIWFSFSTEFTSVNVELIGNLDLAFALYLQSGNCNDILYLKCFTDDNCGIEKMPKASIDDLLPGETYLIRVWAENGQGDFKIKMSDLVHVKYDVKGNASDNSSSDKCVNLTNSNDQLGCVLYPIPFDFGEKFEMKTQVNFGDKDNLCNGNSFSFWGNLLFETFIIEFDTKKTFLLGDPNADHITLFQNADITGPLKPIYKLPNIEDGMDHDIKMSWDPSSDIYKIFFDEVEVISLQKDLVKDIFNGREKIYFGVMGITTKSSNNQSFCLLDLKVESLNTKEISITEYKCPDEPFYFDGQIINKLGETDIIQMSANGCDSIIHLNLIQEELNLNPFPSSLNLSCNGDPLEIIADVVPNQNDVISWNAKNGGNIIGAKNKNRISVDAPGIYTISLYNTVTGCSRDEKVEVKEAKQINVNAGSSFSVDCSNSSYSLAAILDQNLISDATTILWTSDDGEIVSGKNTLTPEINRPGTYVVTVEVNGCIATDEVIILSEVKEPEMQIMDPDPLTCNKKTTKILSTTNLQDYSIQWVGPASAIITSPNSLVTEVNQSGEYKVTILDNENKCQKVYSVNVELENGFPKLAPIVSNKITCSTKEVNLSFEDKAFDSYSVEWFDTNNLNLNNNTNSQSVSSVGNYKSIITNENGCKDSLFFQVEIDTFKPEISQGLDRVLTCDLTSVSLESDVDVSLNYTYQWSKNGNTITNSTKPELLVDSPGVYKFEVTNPLNGCTSIDELEVSENIDLPKFSLVLNDTISCKTGKISVNTQGTSIGNKYIETWTLNGISKDNLSTNNLELTQAGDYKLVILNTDNNCKADTSFTIYENKDKPEFDFIAPQSLSCTVNEVNIAINNHSSGNFEYVWKTINDGIILTDPNLTEIKVAKIGSYQLELINKDNGCKTIKSIEIEATGGTVIADAGSDMILNCKHKERTIGGNSTSGADIEYEWTTNGGNIIGVNNTMQITVDEAGEYILEVKDLVNICSAFDTTQITKDVVFPDAIMLDPLKIDCSRTSVTLDASGSSTGANISYSWATISGTDLSGENTSVVTVDKPGYYQITVKNTDNECQRTVGRDVISIIDIPNFELNIPQNLSCDNKTILMMGDNIDNAVGLDYQWLNNLGVKFGDKINQEITESGDYSFNIFNPVNKCDTTINFSIVSTETYPTVDAGIANLLTCENTTVDLSGSASSGANYSFKWDVVDGGNIISGAGTYTPTVNKAGKYILIVEDTSNGCESKDSVIIIADQEKPTFNIEATGKLNCDNTDIDIASDLKNIAKFEYDWTVTGGNIISGNGTPTITVDKPGFYTLVVKDIDNKCDNMKEVQVVADLNKPKLSIVEPLELNCNSNEITLNLNISEATNTEIEWSTLDGSIVSNISMEDIEVNEGGVYTVKVKNLDNGCIGNSMTTVIKNNEKPEDYTINIDQPVCEGEKGEFFISNIDGGTAPYQVQLNSDSPKPFDAVFSNLNSGNYSVVVIDKSGCELEKNIQINQPIQIGVKHVDNITLSSEEEFQLNLDLEGIKPAEIQSIQWIPAEGLSCADCLSPTITGNFNTNYTVEIITVDGCEIKSTLSVFVKLENGVFAPNIFTPANSDGINDLYTIYGDKGVEEIITLQIYDRWGQMIFRQDNFKPGEKGWDGKFNGEYVQRGVFSVFYKVKFKGRRDRLFKSSISVF